MEKTLLTHVRIDVKTSEIKSETFVCDGRDEAMQKGEELIRRIFTSDFGYDSEDEFIDGSVDDFKAHGTFDDEIKARHLLFVKDESDDEAIASIADAYTAFMRDNGDNKPNYALVKVVWNDGSEHTDAICLEDGDANRLESWLDDDILYYCSDIANLLHLCIPDNGLCEFHVKETISFSIV